MFSKVFGTRSQREVKRIMPLVEKIESLRPDMQKLSDEELRGKTREFKKRLEEGETLDDLLPEAFAVVREAGKRVLGMEHFRVQLIGGIILHQGRIAEMRTGEGKTLVATLPSYLNALEGKGVHVVTVNDYLAKRDAEEMGKIHEFLGLTVGVVLNDMKQDERRAAYNCDVTYVTNNELGFDYLRDNMVIYKEQLVQRDLHYCIIDEVDSILIDEARTPLIISGQSGKSTKLYEACDILAQQLERGEASHEMTKMAAIMGEEVIETGDFVVNEKDKIVNLTEQGVHKVEKFFHIENLADPENLEIQHNITLALRAHNLMHKDQDYVVKDDEILIVDEFTGRIMPGRRYSDGLHQAIEAKEHVKIKRESKTLATITFQNFFNKYDKKGGMTGTAVTEEKEFRDIYAMDVVEIPTNRPVIRVDHEDAVYMTKKEKFNAVVNAVVEAHAKQQPVLVGTITIETSELLSRMLKRQGIKHNVLNAKFHELEAEIVSQAGQAGAVTIATNMAGRGTDIKLDDVARNAGGLMIIGTERHESRRIDNQLRGRSGRQGDPGESRFYISLEDGRAQKRRPPQARSGVLIGLFFLRGIFQNGLRGLFASAHCQNDRRCARHGVTARIDMLLARAAVFIRRDAAPRFGRQVRRGFLNQRIRAVADNDNDCLHGQFKLAAGLRHGTAASALIRLAQFHFHARHGADKAVFIAQNRLGVRQHPEVDAFLLGVVDFLFASGHFKLVQKGQPAFRAGGLGVVLHRQAVLAEQAALLKRAVRQMVHAVLEVDAVLLNRERVGKGQQLDGLQTSEIVFHSCSTYCWIFFISINVEFNFTLSPPVPLQC